MLLQAEAPGQGNTGASVLTRVQEAKELADITKLFTNQNKIDWNGKLQAACLAANVPGDPKVWLWHDPTGNALSAALKAAKEVIEGR